MMKYIILNSYLKWPFYIGMEANLFDELYPSTEGGFSIRLKQPSPGIAPNIDCLMDVPVLILDIY